MSGEIKIERQPVAAAKEGVETESLTEVSNTELYPFSKVQVPSRGFFYEDRLPDGYLDLRPMTTKEEKLLLSPESSRRALLDTLVDRCMVTRSVSIEEMLIGDRFYLLLMIRHITYGATYGFKLQCAKCRAQFTQQLKLPDDLELRVLTEEDEEPYSLTLPISKKVLGLRRLRVRDERAVDNLVKQRAKRGGQVGRGATYILRLARHITSIDEQEVSFSDSEAFCEELIGGDSHAMRVAIEENDCGVQLILEHTCTQCGYEFEETLPVTREFFRPSAMSSKG